MVINNGARKVFVSFVLENLGYSSYEIKYIYNYFNEYEMVEGMLEYVDDNGNLVQYETSVNLKVESYYKFINCSIFKYDVIENDYYSLFDDRWVYDDCLQCKIDNLEYDY